MARSLVRCPSAPCGIVFEPHERWLGRNLYCPACGVRMTARPLEVDAELARRADLPPRNVEPGCARLPFVVLADNLRSLWNVGSVFRTADACGVRRVVLCGISGCPPRPEITKTALGAETAVGWEYRAEAASALEPLRAEGYSPVALERTSRSQPLDEVRWPERVCLVLGNEVAGVSGDLLDACPLHVHIPMRGVKSSLNVAVAFGIAAFAIGRALASRAGAALAVGLLLALLARPVAAGDAPSAEGYPRTIASVWMRTGTERGITGPKLSGDLVITPESLELLAGKRDLSIPFDVVRMISFGTMRGDVDTEWVVLSVVRDGKRELIGLRDGRKLGYGQHTGELYDALRDTARRFSWAQFATSEGFRPYTELDRVFAMDVPADWAMYHHDLVHVDGVVRYGTVVFTALPLLEADDPKGKARPRALAKIQDGAVSAWIVTRREALGGMKCEGFDRGALAALGEIVAADPFFGRPFDFAAAPAFESSQIDGCTGVRLVARAAAPPVVLDLRAVAREGTLVLVGLRTTEAELAREAPLFERAVSSLRLAATR